jgi:hypothetical protein
MIYGIKVVLKYLLGRDHAGRDFAVFPDDTMVVSYPRSGNTWTRFLIANLLHPGEEISFANIETMVPDISTISSCGLKCIPRPRVIKSHEYFDHRYSRVIYIVRDPRDVTLSCYDFQRKYGQIKDGYPLESYVNDFVNGTLKLASWGTWAENVNSWVSTRGSSRNFLLLRYEDMLHDTRRELKRMADFLQLSTTQEILDSAIINCSSQRMRVMEQETQNQWIGTKKHRRDIPFVRIAKAGNWQNNLPDRSVAQIEAAWGVLMTTLGYRLATRPPETQFASSLSPAMQGSQLDIHSS